MEVSGGIEQVLVRLADATERSATANEELIRLATEERDFNAELGPPPHCPFCGTFDPSIQLTEGGTGKMSDYVLVAQCETCAKTFVGLSLGWQVFKTAEEVQAQRGRT